MMSEQYALDVYDPKQFDQLCRRTGKEWPFIVRARQHARERLSQLHHELRPIVLGDTACVVYGSLARLEATEGSDVDWTLLVDGCADAEHRGRAQRIKDRLAALECKQPAPGGPFGNLTYSHDLVHKIGGDDDTNRNTTQRLLLLLESTPIGDEPAYARVIEQVLTRYVEEDLGGGDDNPYRVPRFLQNDVARYWRTMAVDFAHKRRERGAQGWALRTAKLRLSRKLMYASGLLSCYSCDFEFEDPSRRRSGPWTHKNHVLEHLVGLVRTTPLDIVARAVLFYFGEISGPGVRLFSAYDEFLNVLGDPEKRKHLDGLKPEEADGDHLYREVREIGNRFQDSLTAIFFESNTRIRELNQRYGVF